jgi:hypothetical protein
MESKQPSAEILDIQNDIYRLALSSESLFLNGIQFGVLSSVVPGIAQKLADQVLADLATAETNIALVSSGGGKTGAVLTELRTALEKAAALVRSLTAFRSRPFDEIHGAVSQVSPTRDQIASRIQELERCLNTPSPFYLGRPKESVAVMDQFVSGLEAALEREWKVADSEKATSAV